MSSEKHTRNTATLEERRLTLQANFASIEAHVVLDQEAYERAVADETAKLQKQRSIHRKIRLVGKVGGLALLGLGVILVGYGNTHLVKALGVITALCGTIAAASSSGLSKVDNKGIRERAESKVGRFEINSQQADYIENVIRRFPGMASVIHRWLVQGNGRLSVLEYRLIKDYASSKWRLDKDMETADEGGYGRRLQKAAELEMEKAQSNPGEAAA